MINNWYIDDESLYIRVIVVRQDYRFDEFVDDEDWEVCRTVVKQGYGLKKLINDNNENVRKTAKELLNFKRGGQSIWKY